ncbi:WD40 repeat-like protein [Trichodelitschia bisporula]|uniref:WD40 repeat-like protein n=1 Tax=Trichodelitschia bisporula TaxID=703511 RepID=A0A6G1HI86_9PEZI|nr:WD40 repeat-like protein [Trichodelitschia bisporula]
MEQHDVKGPEAEEEPHGSDHDAAGNGEEGPHSRPIIPDIVEEISAQLCTPRFLRTLTPSQLPSRAVSDSSLSPRDRSFDLSRPKEPTTPPPSGLTPNYHARHQHFAAISAWRALAAMAADRGFVTWDHGHSDLVLAVDFNYYGSRMVTASSDQRLKVWDRKDDVWNIVDSWRAHDAEIVDVKWNGPFVGEVIGSVGEDGRFRLWMEDVTEIPNAGRRFRNIFELRSDTRVPYMSLDFKNILNETYLALVTRDGYLSVYEPVDFDNLAEWHVMSQKYLCPTPPRQEETGFKVCFHHERLPCWTAVQAGLDRKSLSLAVAAMDVVKIFRTDKDRRFYIAAELTGARNIIRDVSWANGSMRGFDIVASASKDGTVRIYELHPAADVKLGQTGTGDATTPSLAADALAQATARRSAPNPSGIGAGLAVFNPTREAAARQSDAQAGRVLQVPRLVAELAGGQGAVWRVEFAHSGDVLFSAGDDGAVRSWKKALTGEWLEYAQVDLGSDGA